MNIYIYIYTYICIYIHRRWEVGGWGARARPARRSDMLLVLDASTTVHHPMAAPTPLNSMNGLRPAWRSASSTPWKFGGVRFFCIEKLGLLRV